MFTRSIPLLLLALLLLLAPPLAAESIKDRMSARLPALTLLKDQGLIGEDNQGFIQFRGSEKPQQAVVEAENRDRQAVYELIGDQERVPPLLVGQRRAKKLKELAAPGHWLMNKFGRWHQKK